MKNPFYISNTGYEQQQYSLLMTYDNLHNIVSKEQLHQKAPGQSGGVFTDILATTYRLDYSYDANNKPHAPREITDKPYVTSTGNDVKTKIYDYDPNGNLTHITQKTGDSETIEKLRTNLWDEENRLRAVDITPDAEGVRPIAIYTYDAGGERILKHSNTSVSIYLNGKKVADTIQVDATLYPSGMLVAKLGNNGSEEEQTLAYTKHYFAGTQRVSSKIGTTENLGEFLQDWFTGGIGGPIDVVGSSFGVLENAEEGVIQVYEEFDIEPPVYDSDPVFIPVQSFMHGDDEIEQYFFHPDHLGSTSYITNLLGEVSQHMEYFAFGETFVEEHRSSNNSPYKFNGKELDEETGWYYYGVRYYDPRISVWLSVDPLAEQTMTPYQYTYQNPVRFIDSKGMSGEDIIVTTDSGKELFRLDDGKKKITILTARELYNEGIQWFEPTADNYMPVKSIAENIGKYSELKHFTWDEIANFAEKDRWMSSYRTGGSGDWKARGKPGDGYLMVTVGGEPYWTDAIGQIPFTVDYYTDILKDTGSYRIAKEKTIETGAKYGDGFIFGGQSDRGNSYDNAMIKRAINWAEKRYEVIHKGKNSFLGGYSFDIKKTNYSPNNLKKASNER